MAGQAAPRAPHAILLDCLGTLVRLESPAPRLAAALGVGLEAAERAMRAEIAFYRAHMHQATDVARLGDLRRRCAALVSETLGVPCEPGTLLAALVFTPYDDALPALRALRAAGTRLIVVSNWDVSLHEVLERAGIAPLLDGAVSSAEVGTAKPDPAIVHRALALAGADPSGAWLVGDTLEADVAAARAAGVLPVLIDRDGTHGEHAGVRQIRTLTELGGGGLLAS